MDYSLTVFKNTYDNKTETNITLNSWQKFSEMLFALSNKKGEKGGNNSSPLISPAVYNEGGTRSNKNVVSWAGWCAIDVDDFSIHSGDLNQSLQRICGEYSFICYSTASSTPVQPKFRLVFPLSRHIDKDEISHFWYAVNKHLGDLGDKQTKDLSRMYYVPAVYPDAFNFIFENEGKVMDPDYIKAQYSYKPNTGKSFLDRLPPEMAQAVVNHRKNKMSNDEVVWSSYRDCPFFPKRLAAEYQTIVGAGWYGKMYQIMVATAANAIKKEYPITPTIVANLCREFDKDTGNWYDNRPLELEADRAVEYAYRNI
tara:strand:+ start:20764 stop:21699 length:936 start_codon:yes stop_codon:yes gene_type:complete